MQRGLRLLAAGAALIGVCGVALLATRAGDDAAPADDVAGVQFERTTTTAEAGATTLVAAPPGTTTTSVPATPVGAPTAVSTTVTTARSGGSTTTTAVPRTRQVNERSDNTATFVSGGDASAPISVVPADQRDPFRFIISGQDANQDGTAELRAEMANQTQRDIAFPGGMVLRFHLAKDGTFWKTVELRFPDTTVLAAGGSVEVESAVPLDGAGRYDVAADVLVEYR
jgi:hypothetical protein